MPDYKKMYYMLFNKITDVIGELQLIQCQMEELYMESSESENKAKLIELKRESGEDDIKK